ncbi:uncharacterized protein METZ01_LOCUS177496 [marine metagenome]|uniref:Carboxymuconolactone decarboxylase-like domain-containing protein n=1 Tax=marine metagenome TaxID=408172 RepID=A0A382CFR6_9ZZZZ|tara:strand:+ start:215 stop:523 length:309 start_codon:yes stop_codon:yes gene_type:complete
MAEHPHWLKVLQTNDQRLFDTVCDLQELVTSDNALSKKTKMLMMMLGDAFLARPNGVRILANRARSFGATEEEIVETIQVGYYMGGLSVLFPGLNAFDDVPL